MKRTWKIVLTVLLAVLVLSGAAAAVWYFNNFTLSISVIGDQNVTLEYGSDYVDAGADSLFSGKYFLKNFRHPQVETAGSVDTRQVGSYTVAYSASYLWYTAEAERTVTVIDTVKPVITLTYVPGSYVLPGGDYEEEGCSASDNADGDLTDRIVSERIGDCIRYTVSDNSGNEALKLRYLKIDDPEPPVITLNGDKEMTIQAGTEYEEPGWTADDNVDGDLTAAVTVEGMVNIYHADTYELTYSVTDSWGNTGTAVRSVTVEAIRQPDTVSPGSKVVYLTFDDGPGQYTQQLLDILARYNVKVTFFVVNTAYADSMIAKEAAAGHSIGIHTACHQYKTIYASEDAYFEDLYTMKSIIERETGNTTTLIRFPGGSSNTVSRFNAGIMTRLTQAVTDMGYQYFDWNVDSNDAGGTTTADGVYENVIAGISAHNVSIVLQHDIKGYSVEAVEKIIIWGLANGYTFLPLSSSSPTAHHHLNN